VKQDSFGDANTVRIRPDMVWIPLTVPETMNERLFAWIDEGQASVPLLASRLRGQACEKRRNRKDIRGCVSGERISSDLRKATNSLTGTRGPVTRDQP